MILRQCSGKQNHQTSSQDDQENGQLAVSTGLSNRATS